MSEGEPALACKACQHVVIRDNAGQLHGTWILSGFFPKESKGSWLILTENGQLFADNFIFRGFFDKI
jgi:hypothetical protein